MKPDPRMTSRLGSVSSRITVSEVWNRTPDSLTTSGTVGRAPVAITIWSAVTSSPVSIPLSIPLSIRSVLGPVKVAWPRNAVVFGPLTR